MKRSTAPYTRAAGRNTSGERWSLASRPGRKEWSFQRSYARQTRQQTCEQTCEQRLKQKVRQIDIHCVNLFVHWTALMFKCQSDADCVCIKDASARSNAAPLGNLAGAARLARSGQETQRGVRGASPFSGGFPIMRASAVRGRQGPPHEAALARSTWEGLARAHAADLARST